MKRKWRRIHYGSTAMASNKKVKKTTTVDPATLFQAGDGAIVTLVVGDTQLVVHRAVLAARSHVFATMFGHDMLEASSGKVTITDVEVPVLCQLLLYCYSLQAPQLPAMAAQLLAAADKYGLSALKDACEQQLVAQLDVENVASSAVLAVRHSCPDLTAAAVTFLKANFVHVMGSQGWADAVSNSPEDVVEVSRLLAEPPPEIRSLSVEEKEKRLITAADNGAMEDMRTLVAAGADLEARGRYKRTALHWAASRGHVAAVRFLLGRGAEVDATDEQDNTPLHLAACYGHTAVVRLLVAASAALNARNTSGLTPLHYAVDYGHAEVAAALLEAGADAEARNNDGKTPLDIARVKNNQQLVELLT